MSSPSPSARTAAEAVFSDDVPASELLLDEPQFVHMLRLERKRTERSGRPFVLMLLETENLFRSAGAAAFDQFVTVLAQTTRETDFKGWYKRGSTFGVIFTEIDAKRGTAVTNALLSRVTSALGSALRIEDLSEVRLSFHFYPEHPAGRNGEGASDPALYPDLTVESEKRKGPRIAKRALDIAGSLFGLVALSPLLVLIAVGVKATSAGPVLFRQQRVGMHGRRFTFLKFRSMHIRNDDTVHREYMKAFIAGGGAPPQGEPAVYKMTSDRRVTPLGALLRKTSLDELPQLFNVLMGEMSLVGPRPAIPYEVEAYETWHRRRVLAVKPGITGLWQVSGRSSVKFDDMVRLDVRYASSWTFWLDVRILLQTPRAVIMGSGAY